MSGGKVVAVASPTPAHAKTFAEKHHIAEWFTDYHELLRQGDIQIVSCLPNDLHCQAAVDAARAGKHIICEKPLCMNLQEADQMIAACKEAGVQLMYAEELCFTPKYVRAKQLVDEALVRRTSSSRVRSISARTPIGSGTSIAAAGACCWTWAVTGLNSPAGFSADRGRRPFTPSAAPTYTRTKPTARTTSFSSSSSITMSFRVDQQLGSSGRDDDRAKVYGSQGMTYADLLHGRANSQPTARSVTATPWRSATTRGLTFTMFEEIWNYGFPQEMQHFVDCVRYQRTAAVTGGRRQSRAQ